MPEHNSAIREQPEKTDRSNMGLDHSRTQEISAELSKEGRFGGWRESNKSILRLMV